MCSSIAAIRRNAVSHLSLPFSPSEPESVFQRALLTQNPLDHRVPPLLARHAHVAITARPRRLPHLQLQLLIRVFLRSRRYAGRHAKCPRVRVPVDDHLGARQGVVALRGGRAGGRTAGGGGAVFVEVLATEAGLRRAGLSDDALVGDGFGDDVLEELEVVLARDGVGFMGCQVLMIFGGLGGRWLDEPTSLYWMFRRGFLSVLACVCASSDRCWMNIS